ncbi:ras suppressor protein 1-like [Ciona intestinalis]|nr:ras suppressor protein 1-like isoform X1 [Ciona intestinalis]|eukprot:XP_002126629.2 ras suppressor protein 1-like isoform X1 [Ciona intestinalis]
MSKLKKIVEDSKNQKMKVIDLSDRGIQNLNEVPGLMMLEHVTHLTMSHNKLAAVPPSIGELVNLEMLNLFNNHIEELPTSLSGLMKLKILNLGMNRLSHLPRGFGSFAKLEMLDLSYNNLSENSLPSNFFFMTTLRTLYLADNDFETFPANINKLQDMQVLSLRDNDLISLPKEVGELLKLKELHIQGNRLTVLPPELGNLELTGPNNVFKADRNPWVAPILEQFMLGNSHVFGYIRSDTYKYLHGRHIHAEPAPPPKKDDKAKKACRKPLHNKNKHDRKAKCPCIQQER